MKPFIRRDRKTVHTVPKLRTLGRLLSYVTRHKIAIAAVILLLLLSTVLNLLVPFLLGQGINILSGSRDLDALWRIVIGMVLAGVGSGLSLWLEVQILAVVTQKAIYELRRQLFEQIMTLSLDFFDRRPIGELMSSITNDTEMIALFFRSGLGTLVSEGLRIIFIIVAMLWLNWRLAIAALVIVPLVLAFFGFLSQASGTAFAALQAEVSELNGLMEETALLHKEGLRKGKDMISFSYHTKTTP